MNRIACVIAIGLSTASFGCSDDAGADDGENVVRVTITPNQFEPASVTIRPGQTVRWTWAGGSHNVVSGEECDSSDGKFRSGAPQSGGTFEQKFETAGSFPYYCEPHCSMGMKGTVTVQ